MSRLASLTKVADGDVPGLAAQHIWWALPHKATFSMLTRAASSMYELGLREQQRYPLKRFKILRPGDATGSPEQSVPLGLQTDVGSPGAESAVSAQYELQEHAEDLLEDTRAPHLLDRASEAHFARYPTVEALTGRESMSCLESEALILPETTQFSEHGHAEVKRGQRGREQTHKENVSCASAMRVLRREGHDKDLCLPRRCQRGGDGSDLAARRCQRGGDGSDLAARPKRTAKAKRLGRAKGKAKAKAKPPARPPRTKRRSAYQGWLALNVSGRLATAEDFQEFLRARLDPDVEAAAVRKARELTAVAQRGPTRRVQDRREREMREKARRLKKTWNLPVARARLRAMDTSPFWSSKRLRLRDWRQARKRRRQDVDVASASFATCVSEMTLPQVLQPFAHCLVAHPARHADGAAWWCPDPRPQVLARLPGAMAQQQLARLSEWWTSHRCTMKTDGVKVATESAAGRQRRQCRETAVCHCTGHSRNTLAFLLRFRQVMTRMLTKHSVTIEALRGPNTNRVAADRGDLVLLTQNVEHTTDFLWHHVSYIRYKPFRPVLLTLSPVPVDTAQGPGGVIVPAGPVALLRPTYTAASRHRARWAFAFDCLAYKSLNLSCEYTLALHVITDVQSFDGDFLLVVRPCMGAVREIWAGRFAKIPQSFPWEKVAAEHAELVQGEDGSDEEDDDEGQEDEEPLQDPTPAREAPARKEPAVPALPQSMLAVGAACRQKGSKQPWVRPLVPGHASTKVLLKASTECTLNRITRHSTGETSWVARFDCKDSGSQAPTDRHKNLIAKDPKLKQKTRSMAFQDSVVEHDAFRVTLLWLWRKLILSKPAAEVDLPRHVRTALAPMKIGMLAPCTSCVSGTCKFLEKAPARLLPLLDADVGSEVGVPTPKRSGDAFALAAPASSSGDASALAAPASPCACCGNSPATGDPAFCALCHDMDAGVWRRHKTESMRPQSAGGIFFEITHPLAMAGRGWRVQNMPGDGNCLFATMSVGKVCLLDKSEAWPTMSRAARWAQKTRLAMLDTLKTGGSRQFLDGASIQALIEASTDMSFPNYVEFMTHPVAHDRRSWGGFLEAALMCARWRCRAVFFVVDGLQLKCWSFVGNNVGVLHHGRGRIPLLWTGGHYDLLVLDEDLTGQLP